MFCSEHWRRLAMGAAAPPFSRAVVGSAGLWLWLILAALGWLAHALGGLHYSPRGCGRSRGIIHNRYYSVRGIPTERRAAFWGLWRAPMPAPL